MKIIDYSPLFSVRKLHQLFFYLTLVLLPAQLGKHFWPEWSVILGRRIDYLSPTIYLSDMMILLTLGFWVLNIYESRIPTSLKLRGAIKNSHFVKASWGRKESRKAENRKQDSGNWNKLFPSFIIKPLLLLLLIIIPNIIFSINPLVSVYKWLKVFEFGLWGIYIVKTKP